MQLRKLRNRTPALTELGERNTLSFKLYTRAIDIVICVHLVEIAASMLKRDKQSLVKRVTDLETAMDQQVNIIKVQFLIHKINNT